MKPRFWLVESCSLGGSSEWPPAAHGKTIVVRKQRAVGPEIVRGLDPSDLAIETRVNGTVKPSLRASQIMSSPSFLVAEVEIEKIGALVNRTTR